MSRLPPLSRAEVLASGANFDVVLADFPTLPNSIATLAYRPPVLAAVLQLWEAVIHTGTLPVGLKYLVGHMASMSAGCRYCSAHTGHNAVQAGMPKEKLQALWDYESSPLFNDSERAALQFALLAGQVPNAVSDAEFSGLRKHYRDAEIAELLAVIAIYGFFNRWNDTLGTELEAIPLALASQHKRTTK